MKEKQPDHRIHIYQSIIQDLMDQEEEAPSSGWKIAFADFMTILMCLFLILWLQSADLKVRKEVAKGYNEIGRQDIGDRNAGLFDQDSMNIFTTQNNSIIELLQTRIEYDDFKALKVEKIKDGIKLTLGSAFFISGSSDFNESIRTKLVNLIYKINRTYPNYFYGMDVKIVGHTDNIPVMDGEYEDNWDLAAKRAIHTLYILEDAGVEAHTFTIVSKADSEPVASNDTPEGRQKNRRVEIILKRAL